MGTYCEYKLYCIMPFALLPILADRQVLGSIGSKATGIIILAVRDHNAFLQTVAEANPPNSAPTAYVLPLPLLILLCCLMYNDKITAAAFRVSVG